MTNTQANYIAKLRSSGLRPTKQRIKICEVLFNRSRNITEQQDNIPSEDVALVIKKNIFDTLNQCIYSDLSEENKINKLCPISLEKFKNDEIVLQLPCGHIFKVEEIKEWLLNNSHKCPVCRKSAGDYEPKI